MSQKTPTEPANNESGIEDAKVIEETTIPESAAAQGESPLVQTDDFLSHLGLPKQNFAAGDKTNPTDTAEGTPVDGETAEQIPDGDAAPKKMTKGAMAGSAKAVVGIIEFLLIVAVTYMLKHVDAESIKTDDSERAALEEAWALAMEESGIYVSPWWQVMILSGAIYGPKLYNAYQANNRYEEQLQIMVAQEIKRQQNIQIIEHGNAQPAYTPPPVYTPAASSAVPSPTAIVRLEKVYNDNCPTCNTALGPKKMFCDAECRSRYAADKARLDKGEKALYIGLTKAEADKVAKAQKKK